jgi:formate hydrogenlyase transcriptional activator
MGEIMIIDENEFFREATLRICGSLEIDVALQDLLTYMVKIMPVERLILMIEPHKKITGVVEILADVDTHGVRAKNRILGISEELSTLASELEAADAISDHPSGLGRVFHPARIAAFHPRSRIGGTLLGVIKQMMDGYGKSGTILPFVIHAKEVNVDDIDEMFLRPLGIFHRNALSLFVVLEGIHLGGLLVISREEAVFEEDLKPLVLLLNDPISIAMANAIRFREVVRLKDLLMDQKRFLEDELRDRTEAEIVGADFGLKATMKLVNNVAQSDSPVLLLGETGSGKEVIANAIHYSSQRRNGPYIKVNCGAIPAGLMDSELFGHEKGAFTGAISAKKGRFERAHGGTIFLDEIGELTPDAQVRLLRVLQDKEIERLGSTATIKVDIRVIAATHRDLAQMVEQGKFREDLYYRLDVFPISIPPLRERKVDIPSLAAHFLVKKSREMKLPEVPAFAPEAIKQLTSYNWPGNIRELENAVERALIISGGEPLRFDYLSSSASTSIDTPPTREDHLIPLDEAMAAHIRNALESSKGKIHGPGGAAELLGINPSTLRKRMRKLNIPFGRKIKRIS